VLAIVDTVHRPTDLYSSFAMIKSYFMIISLTISKQHQGRCF